MPSTRASGRQPPSAACRWPEQTAMLPVLGAMGMKGMACRHLKQLDPVIGVDIHLVTIPRPRRAHTSPLCGVLLRRWTSSAAVSRSSPPPTAEQTGDADGASSPRWAHRADDGRRDAGATVKIGFIPARSASTPPRGASRTSHGRRLGGPLSGDTQNNATPSWAAWRYLPAGCSPGNGAHLHLDCNDGHTEMGYWFGHVLPSGCHQPNTSRQTDTHQPGSRPLNSPALARNVGAFGSQEKAPVLADRLHGMVNDNIKSKLRRTCPISAICRSLGHPVMWATAMFFTDGGLLARRPGASVAWGAHLGTATSDYRGLRQRVAPPRHGRRRGHGRGTLTLRMSDGIPVAFPLPTAEDPRSSSSGRKGARLEQDGCYCVYGT